MSKSKKKPVKKTDVKKKKQFPVKKIVIAGVAAAAVAALVVFLVMKTNEDNAKRELKNTTWISMSALNASGDEVDIRQVYNNKYTTYKGTLSFDDGNKFELWLSQGDPSDGTHSGTYELKEDKISVKFDDGTENDFNIHRKDGKIAQIDVFYGEYTVRFFPE